MGLDRYRERRDFSRTPEPRGDTGNGAGEPRGAAGAATDFSFVVQKHDARRLHYDFRLELDGVLLSWAVPKGPSLDPTVKRLAVQTEDHPIEYGGFEGVIPEHEYGGGTVLLWDRGHWRPIGDARAGYAKGHLHFVLEGEKLRGSWHLIRTRGDKSWLLWKGGDEQARSGRAAEIDRLQPESVLTGRALEAVREDPDRVWHSETGREHPALAELRVPAKAPKRELPLFIAPQLATLVDAAPDGDDWLHEIKLDGYRMLARIEDGGARLLTRRGHDWSARLPALVRALSALPAAYSPALIDGELVVLDPSGLSDFQALQNSLSQGGADACLYYAFDLLHVGGRDLRGLPLLERKQLLHQTLAAFGPAPGRIRFSDHERGEGPTFFTHACRLGLEGIVSKRASALYRSERSRSWLKVKCGKRQEFVIGGFSAPGGTREHFGSLLVGVRGPDGLTYAGRVGTGFTQQSLAELHARLSPLVQSEPPFRDPPRGREAKAVKWVRPELVAEVGFSEQTKDGRLRHPSFHGLREDKPASDVKLERAQRAPRAPAPGPVPAGAPAHRVRLSHPERVLYPELGITKRELAGYYLQVGERMLPHLARRPLMLVRCPEGRDQACFHQKHPSAGLPRAIHRVEVREQDDEEQESMVIDSLEGLIGLVQLSALEIHTWGSRMEQIEQPDQLVFDLDPDPELPWAKVAQAARDVREQLAALGLQGFAKSTGGKGLHVVVPVAPRAEWDEAKAFSKALVESLVRAHPHRYVATMTKAKRSGKVFLDYLRNGRGATAVSVYSTRARSGAGVSAPLAWDELDRDPRGAPFDLRGMPERLARVPDPWAEFDAARAPIPRRSKPG